MFLTMQIMLHAASYDVVYHGTVLGRADTLDTLKEHYLQAKVTNFIAKLLIGKRYFVFYSDEPPAIPDAKFRKDNKRILYALYDALTTKPAYKKYRISPIKSLELHCTPYECTFAYIKGGELDGKGYIRFDQAGRFMKLREEISNFEIRRH